MNWYVHYMVRIDSTREPEKLVSGPYTEDEVIDKRRDIAKGANVINCHISQESK